MNVYLDSAPENLVPELALQAHQVLDGQRDGWLRPLATADAFGSFLDRWRSVDRNGLWGYVTEVGGTLVCSVPDDDDPSDEFPRHGETEDGTALYDLSGWPWVTLD